MLQIKNLIKNLFHLKHFNNYGLVSKIFLHETTLLVT